MIKMKNNKIKKFDKNSFIIGIMFSIFIYLILFELKNWFL